MANRNPNTILKDIGKLDNLIVQTKNLIFQFPDDNLLRLTLDQDSYRRNLLVEELKESTRNTQQNALYFFLDEDVSSADLDTLIPNLTNFKSVFDKTCSLLNVSTKMPLALSTTVSGSFGLFFTTPFEGKLFREYDNVIEFVFNAINLLDNSSEQTVHDIIKDLFKGDKILINKYIQFFSSLSKSKKDYRLEWTPIEGEHKKIQLNQGITKRIFTLLSQQNKPEVAPKQIYGIIKGVSLIKNEIDFSIDIERPANNPIKAKFSPDLTEMVKEYLDCFAVCEFNVTTTFNEVTEVETSKYDLINIFPAP